MPSRISIPKLSLFSSSRHSSCSTSSSSSSSSTYSSSTYSSRRSSTSSTYTTTKPTTPISPPARLHLRNILPASPHEPAIMPLPPRVPRAWVWKCHRCQNVYRLSCTRRCLECSHTYCVSATTPPPAPEKKKTRRRRRDTGMCQAEFDYTGWEQWGSWRRKVTGYEGDDARTRDRLYVLKKHNCWIDCDSPSQCCHRRYALAAEALALRAWLPDKKKKNNIKKQQQQQVVLGEVDGMASPFVPFPVFVGADDEREALELGQDVGMRDHGVDEEVDKSPKSPLRRASYPWDDPGLELQREKEKEKEETGEWWVEGVLFEKSSPNPQRRDLPVDEVEDCIARGLTVRNQDAVQDPEPGSHENDSSDWNTFLNMDD